MTEIKKIHTETRAEWRAWLAKNHLKEKRVWLLKHKKHTGKPQVNNSDAMDEAICFGWIDTIIKRVDEDLYMQQFVRRTHKSRWSKNTVARAKRMMAAGLMTPEGMKRYEEGIKKPLLGAGIPDNPDTPKELIEALQKDRKAYDFFMQLSPSKKRLHNRWLLRAKLPETKKKRIEKIVDACKEAKTVW